MREIRRTLAAAPARGQRARPAGHRARPAGAGRARRAAAAGPTGWPPRPPAIAPPPIRPAAARLFGPRHRRRRRRPLRRGEQALIVPRLVGSVLRPLAERSTRRRGAASPAARGAAGTGRRARRPPGDRQQDGHATRLGGGQGSDRAAGPPGPGGPAESRRGRPRRCRTWPASSPRPARRRRAWTSCGSCSPGCRHDPGGRPQRPLPGDQRAAAGRPPGRAGPARAAAGAVPVRRVAIKPLCDGSRAGAGSPTPRIPSGSPTGGTPTTASS